MILIVPPSAPAVALGLLGTCAGFFTIHAAAVGLLNRRLSSGQGRANALYVLFCYAGGWLDITGSGVAYAHGGRSAAVALCAALLLIPLSAGLTERAMAAG